MTNINRQSIIVNGK
jgi:large subunit ribosomal protein L6